MRQLKSRPSLLDLIANRGGGGIVEQSSPRSQQESPASPPRPADLPPLPVSPTLSSSSDSSSSNSTNSTPIPQPLFSSSSTIQTPAPHTMAPSGKGSSSSEDVQTGAVFSISGPVVVAENMIGCAMYELVSAPRAT